MTSRGKFWGSQWRGQAKFWGQWPPWHPPSSAPEDSTRITQVTFLLNDLDRVIVNDSRLESVSFLLYKQLIGKSS